VSLLLEREHELDRLAGRLDAAGKGEGSLVVVQGAPGLGKTSVMRAAVVEAQRRGFEVARARGRSLSVSGRPDRPSAIRADAAPLLGR
jgi:predicted ATPase